MRSLACVLALAVGSAAAAEPDPGAVRVAQEPARRPWLAGSLFVGGGFPQLGSAGLVVHAIPFFDVEGRVFVTGAGLGLGVGGGPRLVVVDTRDAASRGLTLRLSAIASHAWYSGMSGPGTFFGADANADLTWWLARHFGLTVRLGGGVLVQLNNGLALPLATLSLGVSL